MSHRILRKLKWPLADLAPPPAYLKLPKRIHQKTASTFFSFVWNWIKLRQFPPVTSSAIALAKRHLSPLLTNVSPHLVLVGLWWVGAKTQPASPGQQSQSLLSCSSTPCSHLTQRAPNPDRPEYLNAPRSPGLPKWQFGSSRWLVQVAWGKLVKRHGQSWSQ